MLRVIYCVLWWFVVLVVVIWFYVCLCKECGYCEYIVECFGYVVGCLCDDCVLLIWVYVVLVGEMCVV